MTSNGNIDIPRRAEAYPYAPEADEIESFAPGTGGNLPTSNAAFNAVMQLVCKYYAAFPNDNN